MPIGGWFGGKPYDAGCVARSLEPDRARIRDEQPEDAAPVGKVTDAAALLVA